jgi:hypothetical protein
MTRAENAAPTGSGDDREGRWRTLGDTPDGAAARARAAVPAVPTDPDTGTVGRDVGGAL